MSPRDPKQIASGFTAMTKEEFLVALHLRVSLCGDESRESVPSGVLFALRQPLMRPSWSSRRRLTSRTGGMPKKRLYSRLNCDWLS